MGQSVGPVKKFYEQKMEVAEMRMLRWMCDNTIIEFRDKLGVAPLAAKMRENRLGCFGHVKRKDFDSPVRRVESIIVEGNKSRRKPKKMWVEQIKNDLNELHFCADLTRDRNSWRRRIYVLDYQ